MTDAYIPYGGYWSTPFAKWQGTLSHLNSVELAAHVAKDELQRREIDAAGFDMAILGITVPQYKSFYGAPWMTGMMGADRVTGPTIAQALRNVGAVSAECQPGDRRRYGGNRPSSSPPTAHRTARTSIIRTHWPPGRHRYQRKLGAR